ncbi:MAG: helix-turn-helix domain-containing protein [Selenomonadaceae bacterium]|nr:helix-turn-helix domain-containing protein [Selenomonadaceae bacterium]
MYDEGTPLITVEELCVALMIGKNAAYRLLAEGKIRCFRLGRIWKIPRASLEAYIREQSRLT